MSYFDKLALWDFGKNPRRANFISRWSYGKVRKFEIGALVEKAIREQERLGEVSKIKTGESLKWPGQAREARVRLATIYIKVPDEIWHDYLPWPDVAPGRGIRLLEDVLKDASVSSDSKPFEPALLEEARKRMEQYIQNDEERAVLCLRMANAYERLGNLDGVVSALLERRQYRPSDISAEQKLVDAYLIILKKAEDAYESAMRSVNQKWEKGLRRANKKYVPESERWIKATGDLYRKCYPERAKHDPLLKHVVELRNKVIEQYELLAKLYAGNGDLGSASQAYIGAVGLLEKGKDADPREALRKINEMYSRAGPNYQGVFQPVISKLTGAK